MNRRLFVLLVVLMSLSLIGIIAVQLYWIKSSVEDKEEQFSNTVTEVLSKVSEKIEIQTDLNSGATTSCIASATITSADAE